MSKYSNGTLAIITGASQGIGKTIAIEFSKNLTSHGTIVLMARSLEGLNRTKAEIFKANQSVNVLVYPIDLSKAEKKDYEEILNNLLISIDTSQLQNAIIFHNAGQVGVLNKTTEYTDIQVWRNYFDLNLFSVAILNSAFLKTFQIAKNITVVNITSLCGSVPFKNMGMYGSGKAARNLLFKVLAEEEPSVTVLNYSPGPVDTDMVSEVIGNIKDPQMKQQFSGMKENKTILTTNQTVEKLLGVLEKGDFKSGDIIDYYDRV